MVLETVLRTDDLERPDRFPAWCEVTSAAMAPIEMRSEHAPDFHAWMRHAGLGPVELSLSEYCAITARRTEALIRRSDPEMYQLTLPLRGRHDVEHLDRQAAVGAGDLVLCDTSRPYRGSVPAADGRAASIIVQVPKQLLGPPARRLEPILGVRLPAQAAAVGLFTRFLIGFVRRADELRPDAAARFGLVIADLAAALAADALDLPARVLRPSREVLLMRVKVYIDEHLSDPDLAPAEIAAAHHVSVRYLHRLFEAEQATVAAHIRARRLELACLDLRDPALLGHPVHAIAARRGFARPSEFSRAFRAAYGLTPSDCRPPRAAPVRGRRR